MGFYGFAVCYPVNVYIHVYSSGKIWKLLGGSTPGYLVVHRTKSFLNSWYTTWWLTPLSKWFITLVISGHEPHKNPIYNQG